MKRARPENVVSLDLETRLRRDHHQALRLWLRLLTCTNLIEARVKARLRTEYATTLPRFDLMAQLERNPQGLKMGDLSKRLMVSGGNVTGITDQLVEEGLVERSPAPDDRRAFSVKLTAAGMKAFAQMARDHEGWVIDLFSGLSPAEKKQLYQLLAKLKLAVVQTT
ncbi:MAG: MarR family transcriptional regulator [Betaproteobacteria bacterium]|nr:MarR family transcriptional regulator [Betaproteobacteria bacterium]